MTKRGRRTARIAAQVALVAVVAAFASLVAPGEAAAQFGGSSQDYCADRSPYKSPPAGFDPRKNLTVAVVGTGSVAPSMFGTPANCVTPSSACSGPSCTYEVQTVCAFHCYSHLHLDPQHWDVRLSPTETGMHFVAWESSPASEPCRPPSSASFPRTDCIQLMDKDRIVTAKFAATPDVQAPTPPGVTVTPAPYRLAITWTPSQDLNLAGYEVWLGTKLLARTDKATHKWNAMNLTCGSPYTVRVVAFDAEQDASSAEVATATPSCAVAKPPKPNTVLHVKPPRTTKSRTAFFHFGYRGEIKATKYQCKLDKGRWARCSGVNGKRYKRLKKGYHLFQVRGGNAAGWDATPAKWRWRVR